MSHEPGAKWLTEKWLHSKSKHLILFSFNLHFYVIYVILSDTQNDKGFPIFSLICSLMSGKMLA